MRLKFFPLTILLILNLLPNTTAASSITTTTLIDKHGTVNLSTPTPPKTPSNGILTILTAPSSSTTSSLLFPSSSSVDGVTATSVDDDTVLLLTASGSSLSEEASSSRGGPVAAAAGVAGSVVLTGITVDDASDLGNTRHGRTLGAIFSGRLLCPAAERKTLLILAVDGGGFDEEEVKRAVKDLFDACVLGLGESVVVEDVKELEDLYDLEVLSVESEDDANKVLALAKSAASRTSLAPSSPLLPSLTQILTLPLPAHYTTDPPTVTSTLLTTQDSYARLSQSARAKLTAWTDRVRRGFTVDQFGERGAALLQRTLERYDKDTLGGCGMMGRVAGYRRELRDKLADSIERSLTDLFRRQVTLVEEKTLKDFEKTLLRQSSRSGDSVSYDKNAAAVRAAAFAFDTTVSDLEIPPLHLVRTPHVSSMNQKLNAALLAFPDSPALKAREMKEVTKKAAKRKKPTERRVDVGVNLVAMIRPDGFGNLQGFCGYSLGNHGITVGVHNDADAPETISQFGGVRPPFLRVQPKLNFDVEL